MKKNRTKLTLFLLTFILLTNIKSFSQVVISENSGATPDPSSMLDIQSNSKGLLIPRLTTAERTGISSAAEGLLVYDSDLKSFFIYGKTAKGTVDWYNISDASGIWSRSNNNVYLSSSEYNVGIGTSAPTNKLVIKAAGDADTLLEVQDKFGNPLMIITPKLTKFNFIEGAKGVSGGFAVGRYTAAKSSKANDADLLLITSDSARIYTSGTAGKGVSGGFAVGRYTAAKGKTNINKYFYTNFDSTRVYTDGSGKKGVSGGFAVGRYTAAKGTQEYNFFTDVDSTRVFTGGLTKGVSGGFAVGRYTAAKGSSGNYMYMVPENYFIGDQSGEALQNSTYTGKYNTFFGFQTGLKDTSGGNNVFIGYKSGLNNTGDAGGTLGSRNVFLGYEAGFSNTNGADNVLLGYRAGHEVTTAGNNISIGSDAGYNNTNNSDNIFIGRQAGYNHVGTGTANKANNNIYIGYYAGYGLDGGKGENNICIGTNSGDSINTASYNVFLGYQTGRHTAYGNYNTFVGYQTGYQSEGDKNSFFGNKAGFNNTSGSGNTFVGNLSGASNNTGDHNSYFGDQAGWFNGSGKNNVAMGYMASAQTTVNGGDDNVKIGYYSGARISGNKNTFLGSQSAFSSTGISQESCVFIGYASGYKFTDSQRFIVDNDGYISNGQSNMPLIYGEFDNNILQFNADVGIDKIPANKLDVNGVIRTTAEGFPLTGAGVEIAYKGDAGYIQSYDRDNSLWKTLNLGGHVYPVHDNSFDLGSASLMWRSFYAVNGYYSGNVGIGTTAPSSKLEIYGAAQNIEISNTSETEAGLILNDADAPTTQYAKILYNSSNNNLNFYNGNATTKLTVTTTGVNVGSGTNIKKIQAGSFNAGTGSGGVKTVTINFPSSFSIVPNINVTVKGGNYSDVFAVTTRNVGTNSFQVNIYRVDSPGGIWAQTLYLDWYAWEQ